ncbi:hypothetical protein GCM10023238_11560 [Streptomyces heliomycini]
MLRAVRELLEELGLPELEPLDPSALSDRTVMQALRPGAHNAAVLLVPSGAEAMATQALVETCWRSPPGPPRSRAPPWTRCWTAGPGRRRARRRPRRTR